MTATRYIPGRLWGKRQVGQFATRVEGHQRAIKVWICVACQGWNEPAKGKPAGCQFCACPQLLKCDSKGEAQRFVWLWGEQQRGRITGLIHHPRFDLFAPGPTGTGLKRICIYEGDSEYVITDSNERIVEDFKPQDPAAQDPLFKVKRKWVEHQYGLRISIVS